MSAASSSHTVPPPKKKRRSWAELKAERLSTLPQGPTCAREAFEWPITHLAPGLCNSGKAEDEEMWLRLRGHMLTGILQTSDYSGYDCARWAMEMGISGLEEYMCTTFSDPLKIARTCDNAPIPTKVCLDVSKICDSSATCHFHDIADRLPLMVQRYVEQSCPAATASKSDKAQAYAELRSWLFKNRRIAFPADASSHCLVHDKMCKVRPMRSGPCEDCEEADVSCSVRPLRVNVAGLTCVGWSNEGHQERGAHSSEKTNIIHNMELFTTMEDGDLDIYYGECTPKYPAKERTEELMQTAGGALGTVLVIKDGPEFHGYPSKRVRHLWAVVNNITCRWVGVEDYESDFKERFHKSMVMNGVEYMCCSESERHAEYTQMARDRKHNVQSSDIGSMESSSLLELLLAPGGVQRMESWIDLKKKTGSDEPMLFDLEHWPNVKGCSHGPEWPVQLTHGLITALGVERGKPESFRFATAMEHMAAQGFPVASQSTRLGGLPITQIVSGLHPRHIKHLSGNGMNLITQACWMLYIMGNTVRICAPSPRRELRARASNEAEFDDADEGKDVDEF